MHKTYFFLLFLYCISCNQNTVYAQNKAYSEAFFEIEKMFKEDKYSFKKAVFLTENVYFDNKITYSDFCNKINNIVFLCKKFSEANPITDYDFKDKKNISSWGAVFKVLTDTIQVILPNNEKAYHLPFGYDFEDFFGEEDWTKTFVTKLLLMRILG